MPSRPVARKAGLHGRSMCRVPAIVPHRARHDNELPMLRIAIPSTVALFAAVIATPAPRAEAADAKTHWAFKAPVRPDAPATKLPARNPIDKFILARLEKEGLKPAPEADKITLCRRLYLDLIGLPPSPKEV